MRFEKCEYAGVAYIDDQCTSAAALPDDIHVEPCLAFILSYFSRWHSFEVILLHQDQYLRLDNLEISPIHLEHHTYKLIRSELDKILHNEEPH